MIPQPPRLAGFNALTCWAAVLIAAVSVTAAGEEMAFPGKDWKPAAPESQGVDSARLAGAVEYLKAHSGRDGVRELVVVRNGRIVWQGDDVDKVHNEHYSGVTLRHFATMTSGYRAVDDARGHGQSPTPLAPDSVALFEPGAEFAYWDSAQNQFAHVLTRIAEEPIAELFRRRIADPVGMDPAKWRWGDFGERGGLLVNGGAGNKGKGISISAREMARFGHLLLNAGRWNDQQLLSREWSEFLGRIGKALIAEDDPAAAVRDDYFPSPESAGGWRKLEDRDDIRRIGMDPGKLDQLKQWLLESDKRDFAAVVIRRGHVVLQVERGNSAKTDARRVASVSKAVCATVLAIAAEQSQQGLTPRKMSFDDPAFDFIPQARPLSDPRKAQITVKQLLNHTSGLTPEVTGARNQGPWQHVLGHDGDPLTARLAFDPGTKCGYSTFALYHASLVCENVTGKPYDQFAIEMLFRPIGVERWTFEYFDGGGPDGDARYGRHPSHSLGMPARDLARIGYCMLRDGRWQDAQVVPRWFVHQTAAPTHAVKEPELRFNRAAESFSHGWELPARLTDGSGDGIPPDARFKPGSGGQLIAFVPSLDLVVTRQTGSSGAWNYERYLQLACDAVLK